MLLNIIIEISSKLDFPIFYISSDNIIWGFNRSIWKARFAIFDENFPSFSTEFSYLFFLYHLLNHLAFLSRE